MWSNWIEHDGKSMPVPGDTLVLTRRGDGSEDINDPWTADAWGGDEEPEQSNWFGDGEDSIVAYKVLI